MSFVDSLYLSCLYSGVTSQLVVLPPYRKKGIGGMEIELGHR